MRGRPDGSPFSFSAFLLSAVSAMLIFARENIQLGGLHERITRLR